jgi:hypothetical protein
MPKRGSVQLLLLFFLPRATFGWGIGAAVFILLLAGLLQLKAGVPLLDKSGFAQALRQSAWERALAGQSQPERWPWEDLSANMSLASSAKVPRLGLSAELHKRAADAAERASLARHASTKTGSDADVLGDVALGDVAIGDSITFIAADGATCLYRITKRRVVDPHLADGEAERADGGASPFTCTRLDRLIMEATQGALTKGAPQVTPAPATDQQKL